MTSAFRKSGEKPEPKAKEGEIGNPDQEMRECSWAAPEGIRHEDEKEVAEGHDETESEAHGGFLAVGRDAERNCDKGEGDAGE
jgi:hypothetical protein